MDYFSFDITEYNSENDSFYIQYNSLFYDSK
jgi:hypothetical protein